MERICEGLGVTVGYFMKEDAIRGDLDAEDRYDFFQEINMPCFMEEYESKGNFFKCENRERCFEDIKKELFKE